MSLSHKEARALCQAAFALQYGREPTTPEAQCLQAIAGLETTYGAGWHGAGVGSFNMGAIQKGGWQGATFVYTDTHPNADGSSTPYRIEFRKYPSAVAGFQDLCRVVYAANPNRKAALVCAGKGDLLGFSTALHKYPCYYEGFGATDAARIANHMHAVAKQIQAQCAALGEEFPTTAPLPAVDPALFVGCTGPAVAAWQAVVGVATDGSFGPKTQVATRAWQSARGLPANGVVCEAELRAAGMLGAP